LLSIPIAVDMLRVVDFSVELPNAILYLQQFPFQVNRVL